jgi:hypothetical protein
MMTREAAGCFRMSELSRTRTGQKVLGENGVDCGARCRLPRGLFDGRHWRNDAGNRLVLSVPFTLLLAVALGHCLGVPLEAAYAAVGHVPLGESRDEQDG